MRHFVKYDLLPVLSVVLVCLYPCFFLYTQNIDEVPIGSMLPFFVVFILNAAVIFGAVSPFLRNVSRSAVFTSASMLVVINFCLVAVNLKRVMPFFRDRYLLLVFGILLLGLFLLLLRKKWDLRTVCLLVVIAFSSIMAMNFIMAVPKLLTDRPREVIEKPGDHHGKGGKDGRGDYGKGPHDRQRTPIQFGEEQPNVYYFLFDEYGGYHNLKQYYDFDNSPFLRELEERGFNVSYDSRNTEAVNTDTIMPNLLNLDYVVKVEDPWRMKNDEMQNFYLGELFRQNGYQVNLINHVDYLGDQGCRVLTKNQTRRTISEYLMRNSLYNKSEKARELLENFFVVDYGANYRQGLDNALEMGLKSPELTEGKTLTVGYIQCPHSPTMVGPNGEELPYATGWRWTDHSLYLGQVEFINKYILQLVDAIQEQDPEAMIILQSDHGNRYAIHMLQLKVWEEYDPHAENQYMQNILNCVYYQGKSYPIEGETGINTMRMMLREVFGADFPPIEPVQDYSYGYEDEGA